VAVAAEADPDTTSPSAFATAPGERAVAAVVISLPFASLVGAMTAYSVDVTAGVLTGVLVLVPLVAYVARFLAGGVSPSRSRPASAFERPAPLVEPIALGMVVPSPSAGERTCAACGTRFVAARVNQRYCGHDCRRRAAAARRRASPRR
jgi:hypothetical protein